MIKSSLFMLLIVATSASAQSRVDWMAAVAEDGQHNAFTDLVRWKDQYYLCYRAGTAHNSMDGEIRVMRSPDMRNWTPAGRIDTLGDDRDPHFATTDDTLYVYFGTWSLVFGDGVNPPQRGAVRSHVATSQDGETWSDVRAIYDGGWWVWRIRYIDGAFLGAAYTAVRPAPETRELRLLRSTDGLKWDHAATIDAELSASETDFWFENDGTFRIIARSDDNAVLFESDGDFANWRAQPLNEIAHAPVVLRVGGQTYVTGRARTDAGTRTKIWSLQFGEGGGIEGARLNELLTLPSAGDTSYAGMIADPAAAPESPAAFISWYAQLDREGGQARGNASSVYVARVELQPQIVAAD